MRRDNPERLVKCIIKNNLLEPQEFTTSDNLDNVLRANLGNNTFKYCYDLGKEGKQIVYVRQRFSNMKTIITENRKFPEFFAIQNNKVMYKTNNDGEVEINGYDVLNWERLPEDEIHKKFNVVVANNAIERRRQNNNLLDNPSKKRKNSLDFQTENAQQKKRTQEINQDNVDYSSDKFSIAYLVNSEESVQNFIAIKNFDNLTFSQININNSCETSDVTLFGHHFQDKTIASAGIQTRDPINSDSTSLINNTLAFASPVISQNESAFFTKFNDKLDSTSHSMSSDENTLDPEELITGDPLELITEELTRQDKELNFSDLFYRM